MKPYPFTDVLRHLCPDLDKALVVLLLENPIEGLMVHVGGLGDQLLRQSVYAYVGSTFEEDRGRWRSLRRWKRSHIEYLLRNPLIRVVGKCCKDAKEGPSAHVVARRVRWYGSVVHGFDVYECGCEGHLIRLDDLYGLIEELQKQGFECGFGERAQAEVELALTELSKKRSMGSATRFRESRTSRGANPRASL